MSPESLAPHENDPQITALIEEIILMELSVVAPDVGDTYVGTLMRGESAQERQAAKKEFDTAVRQLRQEGQLSSADTLLALARSVSQLSEEDKNAALTAHQLSFSQNR